MAWQRWAFQGPGTWKEAEPQARASIQKALELDDRLPEAYVAPGQLQYRFDWDWKGAENAIRRALELDPNNLDAHFNNALLQMALGLCRKPLPKSKLRNNWTRSHTRSR
jgi:Tfp pilus assembly protein PilF